MADIVLFTPLVELDAAANLQGFIDMCRDKLTVFGANLPFQDNVWDVTDSVAIKGRGNKRERITFSNAATVGTNAQEIMREPFLSFAKAYLRYMHGMRPTKVIHNRWPRLGLSKLPCQKEVKLLVLFVSIRTFSIELRK